MKIGKLRSKRTILIIVVTTLILMFSILGILVYSNYILTKEASADIIDENESIADNLNKDIVNEVEATEENIIDENLETDEEKNENNNKNPSAKEGNIAKNNSKGYYIKVNYGAQVVTIYGKDENGNYTVPVKAMTCSTGTSTPTSGKYNTPGRKQKWGTLFGHTPGTYVYGQYVTDITGNILFHSVPYTVKANPSTLEYNEYDKLGTKASAGCIRLTVQDAKWIYDNVATGTTVEFYSDSNPGPLGKPSTKKISSYPDNLRSWDPTDASSNNPWRTYKEQQVNNSGNNNANSGNASNSNTNNNTTNNVPQTIPTITMPNLIGLTLAQAEQKLSELGVKYNTKMITSLSKENVFYQSIPAGTNKTANEYGTVIIKSYKKVNQVNAKINVVNSSANTEYNGKIVKLLVNNKELTGTFNGNSYLGTTDINTTNVVVKVYIDNKLLKTQDFNINSILEVNENISSSISITINV